MAPNSALGVHDSPRIGTLSDVPEEGTLTPGRNSPSSGLSSPYIHPSMSTSTSTFKSPGPAASSSSLNSLAAAQRGAKTQPSRSPSNPSMSSASVTSASGENGTGLSTPTSEPATLPKIATKRSKSPSGTREKEKDGKEGKSKEGHSGSRSKGSRNISKSSTAGGKEKKGPYFIRTPQMRPWEEDAVPATLMHWSPAPQQSREIFNAKNARRAVRDKDVRSHLGKRKI